MNARHPGSSARSLRYPPRGLDPRRPSTPLPSARLLWSILVLVTLLIAAAAIGLWYVATDDGWDAFPWKGATTATSTAATPPQGKAAAILVPPVEPVRYLAVGRDEARALNAAVPFSKAPNPAARPLMLALAAGDQARATDCLAAAVWYEAGNDVIGQQAVAQVVINRLRHPAFPKTVCGVVFQGSERATGCQFSFTCDGSMVRRRPSPEAWLRARGTAYAELHGLVFAAVGWATHYHTDWVVPYWSAKVDKIAAVDTHLFFRWLGAAGQPAAFSGRHQGTEPFVSALAGLSPDHIPAEGEAAASDQIDVADLVAGATAAAAEAAPAPPVPPALLRGNRLIARDAANNAYLVQIVDQSFTGALAPMALDLCQLQPGRACTVYGTISSSGALDASGRPGTSLSSDFVYQRDTMRGREVAQWNCARWKRPTAAQCLPGSVDATP